MVMAMVTKIDTREDIERFQKEGCPICHGWKGTFLPDREGLIVICDKCGEEIEFNQAECVNYILEKYKLEA